MACTWRIRHKLMLGMTLVIAIMALLLGGTLHGLTSYRAVMATCESKLEELDKAVKLKEQIRLLYQRNSDDPQQARNLDERLPKVKDALEDFKAKFQETLDRGRAPDQGRGEKGYVIALENDLQSLEKALKDEQHRVVMDSQHADPFAEGSPIRKALDQFSTDVGDLIGTINFELTTRIETTRKEARKSIMLLITTGILALLLMASLLRFFYRWVAQPIRDLELGVSRVARGDFQHRIEIHSGDEIEDLAKAYNDMTDKLRAMYENLAQQVNRP